MAEASDKLKVFVSYSRADIAFADQLVLALQERGFEPLIDRHDIDAAEKWKERLHALIFSCDTVAFVLSEKSAGSPICAWEVAEAAKLGKRMIPIVPAPIVGVEPPAALTDLNYIFFYPEPTIPGSGFYDGVQRLDRALRTDLSWLREATRLAEAAALWRAQGQVEDRLLRGEALAQADAWAARAPKDQTVQPEVARYLAASTDAQAARAADIEAQLEERRQTLADREKALIEANRAQSKLRTVSIFSLLTGLALSVAAIFGGYSAWKNSITVRQEIAQSDELLNEIIKVTARHDLAKPFLEENYRNRMKSLGRAHKSTKKSAAKLMITYAELGDYEKVRSLIDELKNYDFIAGLDNTEDFGYYVNLSSGFIKIGDFNNAILLLENIYEKSELKNMKDSAYYIDGLDILFRAYLELGMYPKAEKIGR